MRVTTQPPTVMAADGGEPAGAVHEGAGGEVAGPGAHDGLADAVEAPVLGHAQEVAGVEPAKRSSWRHMTPLGMPVVPPVYSK